MRWGSWLLIGLGVVFFAVGAWAHSDYGSSGRNASASLIGPMFIGGSILLAAGVALRSCGYGCYGCYDDDSGCGCGHCDGCKGGECCGHCGCEGEVAHEHGPEGHHH